MENTTQWERNQITLTYNNIVVQSKGGQKIWLLFSLLFLISLFFLFLSFVLSFLKKNNSLFQKKK